jgi:hypothetical protein
MLEVKTGEAHVLPTLATRFAQGLVCWSLAAYLRPQGNCRSCREALVDVDDRGIVVRSAR